MTRDEHWKLDAEIAVKAFGYRASTDDEIRSHLNIVGSVEKMRGEFFTQGARVRHIESFRYSSDRGAALDMVEDWEGDFELRRQSNCFRATFFNPSEEDEEWGETMELAIAKARLRAANRHPAPVVVRLGPTRRRN